MGVAMKRVPTKWGSAKGCPFGNKTHRVKMPEGVSFYCNTRLIGETREVQLAWVSGAD